MKWTVSKPFTSDQIVGSAPGTFYPPRDCRRALENPGYFALGCAIYSFSWLGGYWDNDLYTLRDVQDYEQLPLYCSEPGPELAQKLLSLSRFPYGSEHLGFDGEKLPIEWNVIWESEIADIDKSNLAKFEVLFNQVEWR